MALFLDGCFWHVCPDHYRSPKTSQNFWRAKVERNKERDARVTAELESEDWTVISLSTAKSHVYHIFDKLEAKDCLQAANRARELKLI